MSDQINDGGPAFPFDVVVKDENGVYKCTTRFTGMTLRDYFAGQAIPKVVEFGASPESTAKRCYDIADEMIAARKASQ